jgi:transcriptional regulator, BolA protein family
MNARAERLRAALEKALTPVLLEIEDQSDRHAGHAGAAAGGHFRVRIVAHAFEGHGLVGRHRMVYEAASALLNKDVHALSISAHTPAEDAERR